MISKSILVNENIIESVPDSEQTQLILLQMRHNRLRVLVQTYAIVWLSGIVLFLASVLGVIVGTVIAAASIIRARSSYIEMKKIESELESRLKVS